MSTIIPQVVADNRDAVVFGAALVVVVLLAVVAWRFWRTGNRSKKVANLAAAIVMVWTSEGLWNVATDRFGLPVQFAAISFFVFELLLLAAALRAEEERAEFGHPGAAGRYAFVIGGTSGLVSSFGAHTLGEVVFRVVLPLVALGLWWVLLVARRPTDTPEMLAERQRRAAERDSAWVWTPRKALVALGVMKPGSESVTEAQRRHQIRRMVDAADTIALGGRGAARAARRLRRLTRTATDDMVAEVARQQRKAALSVSLMVTRELPPEDLPSAPEPDLPPAALEPAALVFRTAEPSAVSFRPEVPDAEDLPPRPADLPVEDLPPAPEAEDAQADLPPALEASASTFRPAEPEDAPEDLPPAASAQTFRSAEAAALIFRPEPEDLPPLHVDLPPEDLPSAPEAEEPAASNGHRKTGGSAADGWRRKYDVLIRQQPNLTRKEAAVLLGTSERTLRAALNGATNKE